jgi:hypothetical protein
MQTLRTLARFIGGVAALGLIAAAFYLALIVTP